MALWSWSGLKAKDREETQSMLPSAESYEELIRKFRWVIPEVYNIGQDCCDKWADGRGRLAILHKRNDGALDRYSFDWLKSESNRLANALKAKGVERGDRVAVLLPQRPETAVAHIAIYKLGAIAVPLFVLFGPDALEYRLRDSGARALITDRDGLEKVLPLRSGLPELKSLISLADAPSPVLSYRDLLEKASASFSPADTRPDDPAVIIYTSGTTGSPKGALHGHRILLGHLPGVEMPQELFPKKGDLFWTPADWAWIGGLFDVLLPSLHHGIPVLAHRFAKFDPEAAFALMAEAGVRNAFLPPTALKMLRQAEKPAGRFAMSLRSIGSGGETLGEGLLEWGRETFGFTINEFYGQTECNLVLSNCAGIMAVNPGSMGRAVPGHRVAIIDGEGRALAPGEEGDIAVARPDPVMFLRYWNNPEASEEKFRGDWLVTGDRGVIDEEGYFRFVGRDDDVITSAGYRIGPGEIEDCLLGHPAVKMAAAVGVPDPVRTERVKAFIVLNEGFNPGDDLAKEIQDWVKQRLAAYEYPREVAFLDDLPMTATGKIMRRELRQRG